MCVAVWVGATKRGLPQLTDSLVKELDDGVEGDEPDDSCEQRLFTPLAVNRWRGTSPTRRRAAQRRPERRTRPRGQLLGSQHTHAHALPHPTAQVNVHTLSPGMVFTDLLLNDSTPKLRKFPFGVLAAQPPEVAQDLVPKILATSGNGQKVEFLTTDRILTKFFERFVQGKKSEYIDDNGNVIKVPGAQYLDNGVRVQY